MTDLTKIINRDFFNPHFNLQAFFDSFFNDFSYNEVCTGFDSGFPIVNVYVDPDYSWKLEVALAGWNKDSINVSIENGVLIVEGKNEIRCGDHPWKLVHGRIKNSNFTKRFRISNKLDIEKANVKFVDGILTIIIPAKEEAKPRQLTIK